MIRVCYYKGVAGQGRGGFVLGFLVTRIPVSLARVKGADAKVSVSDKKIDNLFYCYFTLMLVLQHSSNAL